MPGKEKDTLWTRDFTIITAGSAVSMFGNAMSGFAMSLMVLDISESTLLYAVYIAMYTIPQLIAPVFSGALLDRYSRKKTIYTLDFISSGLYVAMAAILSAETLMSADCIRSTIAPSSAETGEPKVPALVLILVIFIVVFSLSVCKGSINKQDFQIINEK